MAKSSIPTSNDYPQGISDQARLLSLFSGSDGMTWFPGSFGYILKCAWCGEHYLHHETVKTFDPAREDAKQGTRVVVRTHNTTIDTCMTGNRSPRRGSVVIEFQCEMCNKITELVIIQHKGNSYLDVLRG
jgi:hypothetical protein